FTPALQACERHRVCRTRAALIASARNGGGPVSVASRERGYEPRARDAASRSDSGSSPETPSSERDRANYTRVRAILIHCARIYFTRDAISAQKAASGGRNLHSTAAVHGRGWRWAIPVAQAYPPQHAECDVSFVPPRDHGAQADRVYLSGQTARDRAARP